MAKLKNVSTEELKAADEAASDLLHTLHDLTNRIEKMYVDPVEAPLALARTFNSLTRASADMVMSLMMQHAMQEQRNEINRLAAERKELESKS